MLWQNAKAIIIGKNQNTIAEINQTAIAEYGIKVARRLSGGGAVYHDLGNLNFTFITADPSQQFLFDKFYQPIIDTIAEYGVKAEKSSRNDITIAGRKFSGNAQYFRQGLVMHHGTILFDSDLSLLGRVLNSTFTKTQQRGVTSQPKPVTNLREYLGEAITLADFEVGLKTQVVKDNYQTLTLSATDEKTIQKLVVDKYATWAWNYGSSPRGDFTKQAYIAGCGNIQLHFSLKDGKIAVLDCYGDYFGNQDFSLLRHVLLDQYYQRTTVAALLSEELIAEVFHNLSLEAFLNLLFT